MTGVEAPIETLFRQSTEDPDKMIAYLEVAVHPGTESLIDSSRNPWQYGEGDSDLEDRLSRGQAEAIRLCREAAANSAEAVGRLCS